jgi:hypothetical protein
MLNWDTELLAGVCCYFHCLFWKDETEYCFLALFVNSCSQSLSWQSVLQSDSQSDSQSGFSK